MSSPIEKVLANFSEEFRAILNGMTIDILNNLDENSPLKESIEQAWVAARIYEAFDEKVRQAILEAYEIGSGQSIPLLPSFLEEAWDDSGMTLSAKIHGADQEMRDRIVSTIREQLKLNRHALQAARVLYDGYNSGQRVTRQQPIPKYLQKVVDFARRSDMSAESQADVLRAVRRARKQVARLGEHGAPNQALKTAYSKLLDIVVDGSENALTRAVHTAVEENSRYVAERIARTESARAWADGFAERYMDNERVVAFQWKLASRHPKFDICDLYAEANLYGLGRGIYPKDATPRLPVHPHCLCHLAPIYASELKGRVPIDNFENAGRDWLKRQTLTHRQQILGVAGNKQFDKGADWTGLARNYSDEKLKKPHADREDE